jgi:transposase-like protein
MATSVTSDSLDMEIIAELRQLASKRAGLDHMVTRVQQRLGFSPEFIVPVFAYFCRAFSLPLVELLPLREYSDTRDVPELEDLLSKIRQAELAARLPLIQAAANGNLDEVRCPHCESQTVSVLFTRPTPTEYHTWFVCSACDFSMRTQNSSKPEHYSTDRDRTGKKTVSVSQEQNQ